jgi:CRISPR-associated Csx2 family protein
VPRGELSFDLTHGFRHLGMLGMLSAFMLERIGRLRVRSLWYGALDMTEDGATPVLRLDGLYAIQRWVTALEHFDASGDYGVFAPLLVACAREINHIGENRLPR